MPEIIKFVEMKRLVIIFAFFLSIGVALGSESRMANKVNLLVKEYSMNPDFEVVDVGRLGLSLVRTMIRANSLDEETRQLLSAVRNVKRVTVVDYEDCSPAVKARFTQRLSKVLDKGSLLLQAKDSGEVVEIYGDVSPDADVVTDLIINASSSGALICIKGTVPMDKVARIIESQAR